eukprot:SAG31_NODE_3850_length_3818_cov_2.043291_1_plen_71_part_00
MALAWAENPEIPPISKLMSLSWKSIDISSIAQGVFPGPNPLIPQRPQNPHVEAHRQDRWLGFAADSVLAY